MRRPLRTAALALAIACAGGVFCLLAFGGTLDEPLLAMALGAVGVPMVAYGSGAFAFAALSALGEYRLRRGIGVIARWTVPPGTWVAFLDIDARYAASQPDVHNILNPRPATAAPVEVIIGLRQILLDEAYHPLRHNGLPSLQGVAWLRTEGAPDCLHFSFQQPAGRFGGVTWLALRVPVPASAHAQGQLVLAHFRSALPAHPVPAALRRPGMTAAWGFGTAAVGAAVAFAGWWLGDDLGDALLTGGLILASLAWLTTLILLGAALLRRSLDGTNS